MNILVALSLWIGACLVILSQTAEAKLKEGECEGKYFYFKILSK